MASRFVMEAAARLRQSFAVRGMKDRYWSSGVTFPADDGVTGASFVKNSAATQPSPAGVLTFTHIKPLFNVGPESNVTGVP